MILPGNGRNNLWFGTEEWMQWIRTPNRGATMDVNSWQAEGTYLSGGGWSRQSADGHMVYVFEWPDSSTREFAQLLRDYRRGTYGRGPLYLIDPLIYDTNILPSRWADPSISVRGGVSLVYGVRPDAVPNSGWETHRLPVTAAYYDLTNIGSGYRGARDSLFIPIPEGYTLYLGCFYEASGTGVVEAYPVDASGNVGSPTTLTGVSTSATNIVPDTFSGGRGVRLQIGTSSSGAGSVTLKGAVARLHRTGKTPPVAFTSGPWIGGMGNSGVQFSGEPTYSPNSGINGGQISVSASFREVGDWR